MKNKFKQIVDNAVKIEAIKHLNAIAESYSKSKYLMKPNLKREDYFNDQNMSRNDVEMFFFLRTHMIDVKKNLSSKYNNSIGCRLCLVYVEDQKYLMNCDKTYFEGECSCKC